MLRTSAWATCLALLVSALLLAESPRKKDSIEPPPPAKPKIEPPPKAKETPPAKPKIEPPPPPKVVTPAPKPKPKVEPPPVVKPMPQPERTKPVVAKSPFTTEPSNLEKTTTTKMKEKTPPPKKKPVIEKPKTVRKPASQGGYVHAVTISLSRNAPTDTADRMVADCHSMLARIPSVRSLKAGQPAEKNSVEFVRKDYSVGLLVLVDDHQGLTDYLQHPLHRQFLDNYRKYIDSVRVFDFMDEK